MGRFLAPLDLGVVLGAGGGGTTSGFGTAAEAAAEGGASTAGSAASSLLSGSCGSYILSRGSFFLQVHLVQRLDLGSRGRFVACSSIYATIHAATFQHVLRHDHRLLWVCKTVHKRQMLHTAMVRVPEVVSWSSKKIYMIEIHRMQMIGNQG